MNVCSGPCSHVVMENLMMVVKQLSIRTLPHMHSQGFAFLEHQTPGTEHACETYLVFKSKERFVAIGLHPSLLSNYRNCVGNTFAPSIPHCKGSHDGIQVHWFVSKPDL